MRGDMVVALGRAAVDGVTLFGHNVAHTEDLPFGLVRSPAHPHALGEVVRACSVEVPEVRQTFAFLGSRVAGQWGCPHGVNDQGVALGCTWLGTRFKNECPGLTAPELVRLTLERSHSALHAIEMLTSLIGRHGLQGAEGSEARGAAFLIADGREAFLVEAAAHWWVWQEVHEVRAASDGCTITQDWDAIAPGLSSLAIEHGWWPEDGTKVDFARAIGEGTTRGGSAMRRWGQATLQLEEQNGHIDAAFLRRYLADSQESPEAEAEIGASRLSATSLLVQLDPGQVPLAWWALGMAHESVYFPLPPMAEIPTAMLGGEGGLLTLASRLERLGNLGDRYKRARLRAALEGLQTMYEGAAAEFLAESLREKKQGNEAKVVARATRLVQRCWEEFAEVCDGFPLPMESHEHEEILAAF